MWANFSKDETGQDMVEYALLIGFIALAGAGTYLSIGQSVTTLWTIINGRLTDASK